MARLLVTLLLLALIPGSLGTLGAAWPTTQTTQQTVQPLGGPDARGYSLTDDLTQIVFEASHDFQNTFQLYRVPITGGTAPQISPPNANTDLLGIPADSMHALYLNWAADRKSSDLYLVPISGGAAVKLNQPISAPNLITNAHMSPDRRYALYYIGQTFNGVSSEIDSVALDTYIPHRLTPAVAGDSLRFVGITPDSTRLIFELAATNAITLYSTLLSGGNPIPLDTTINPTERDRTVLAPDSQGILLTRYQSSTMTYAVYRIPIAGGARKNIAPSFPANSSVELVGVSSDNHWAVVRVKLNAAPTYTLYSVPLDGSGAPIKLVDGLDENVRLTSFAMSNDGQHVVYWIYRKSDGAVQVYSVPIGGGAIALLSKPTEAGGPQLEPGFMISPDSLRVVMFNGKALYSVPIAGGAEPIQINAPLANGGNIQPYSVRFSPDGRYVLYRGETNGDFRYDLIATPTDGSSPARIITPSSLYVAGYPYLDFDSHEVTPDSRLVLFLAGTSANGARTLYSADLAAAGGPVIRIVGPSGATVGSQGLTLTIQGANFVPGTLVEWNGQTRTATFVDGQHIKLTINSDDLDTVTTIPIRVAAPSGEHSSVAYFFVTPQPQVTTQATLFIPLMRR